MHQAGPAETSESRANYTSENGLEKKPSYPPNANEAWPAALEKGHPTNELLTDEIVLNEETRVYGICITVPISVAIPMPRTKRMEELFGSFGRITGNVIRGLGSSKTPVNMG